MDSKLLFKQMYKHISPKKSFNHQLVKDLETMTSVQKKHLATDFISEGELKILNKDLYGLKFFEHASNLTPKCHKLWYKLAQSLYEYGVESEDEKALLFASKCYKITADLVPDFFDAYFQWANVLSYLGKTSGEFHYFQTAKKKYHLAMSLSKDKPKETLHELYWDYALLWTYLAEQSGEAVDIKNALKNFEISLSFVKTANHEFWLDYGIAYMQIGLFINDDRFFFESLKKLEKAVKLNPNSCDSWTSLAEVNTHLYINTMHEKYFLKAKNSFSQALKIFPKNPSCQLRYAQLLSESGRLNKDPKKLELSIEQCLNAKNCDPKNPVITAQLVESQSLLGAYTNRLDLILEAEEKILEATSKESDQPDLWYGYGICCLSFGIYYDEPEFYELAIEKLQCGISLNRTSAEIWHVLAFCHSTLAEMTEDTELYDRAIKFYKKAIDLKPTCPPLMYDYALTLFKMSELTSSLETVELSLTYFEKTIQDQKEALIEHPEWLFYYACCLDLMGDFLDEKEYYERASEIFLHILLIDPDYPNIYYRLAVCFFHIAEMDLDKELTEKSLNYFQLAVKQDEEDDMIWLDWGLTLIHLAHLTIDASKANKIYLEAEKKFIKAGKLGSLLAYYQLACVNSLLERYQTAMTFLEKAHQLKILPSLEDIFMDDWLDGLRGTSYFEDFCSHIERKQQKELP